MAKMSAQDIMNNIRNKAKLTDGDFSKSMAIKLKAGKIKFQLVAKNSDFLFRSRVQHMIPTVPDNDNPDEKWMVADCAGDGCPVCKAANAFKQSGVELDAVNEAYSPKYPYKTLRAVFTQPEHFLLCAKVLGDNADDGSYLPKGSEIGSTHLIQFNKTALNNLMAAYEDFIEDNEDMEDVPSLFAIFDDNEKVKNSLVVTCRISMQPYSCTFSFGKSADIKYDELDEDKLNLLEEAPTVPPEHYEKCIERIKEIQHYFVKSPKYDDNDDDDDSDLPFDMDEPEEKKPEKKTSKQSKSDDDDDDLSIDDLL